MVIKVLVRDRARFTAPVMGRRGVLAVFAGLVAACSSTPPPRAGGRIVGLGNPVTETLYALGVGERVVGADLSSQHPAAAAALPKVGYYRQFSAEGVLSLAPDLVLASDGAGPAVALERVRGAGVVVQVLALADDLAGARANVRAIAAAVDRVEEGERLISALDATVAEAEALVGRTTTRPRALFVYARGPGMVQVAGLGTPAAELMRLAGAVNAVDAVREFKPISAEAVIAARPDFVVVPSRGLESVGGTAGLLALPGVLQTPAGAAGRVIAIDDLKLLGFGPRVGEALLELVRALHPELSPRT